MNSHLNIADINELLFQSDNKITSHTSTKSNEFNFAQVWGEIDAAAIALNEQSSSFNEVERSSLSAFIGDITPAATAVVLGASTSVEESPLMNTPYLDSCISTPFTPASVFTPSLAQFNHNSPYYSPYIDNSFNMNGVPQQDDIQVASYLKNPSSWHTPATVPTNLFASTPAISSNDVSPELLNSIDNFNGDPTQLLLDNNNNNTAAVEESYDSLFPPLPSDNTQQQACQLNNATINNNNNDLFSTEDFEAGNFLDECFDDCFFIELDTTPSINSITQVEAPVVNKKRKNDEQVLKKNKRVKIAKADADQRKFQCDICHAVFNRRYNLGTHIKTHDKNRSKDFSCHLCLKPFDRKHDLTRHISTVHNGERAYSCQQCTSTFSRKDALVRHHLQKHQVEA